MSRMHASSRSSPPSARSPSASPTLRERFSSWLFQTRGRESGEVFLHRRRVFIIPSRAGMAFGLTLLLLLVGSINYALSLGFVLTFFVGSTAVIGMNYTWRNLAHVRLKPLGAEPVFAGETAEFAFAAENPKGFPRHALRVAPARTPHGLFGWMREEVVGPRITLDLPAHGLVRARYPVRAERRGWLSPPRLRITTSYPLGLWRAWAYWEPDLRCLVYPAPEPQAPPLPGGLWHAGDGGSSGLGQEDFAGVREYQVGDTPRHIAWKVVARLDERLATKAFEGAGRRELWLRWTETPESLGSEGRLARLAAWVLEADAQGLEYGLELPAQRIGVARGPTQRTRCLEALALEPHHA